MEEKNAQIYSQNAQKYINRHWIVSYETRFANLRLNSGRALQFPGLIWLPHWSVIQCAEGFQTCKAYMYNAQGSTEVGPKKKYLWLTSANQITQLLNHHKKYTKTLPSVRTVPNSSTSDGARVLCSSNMAMALAVSWLAAEEENNQKQCFVHREGRMHPRQRPNKCVYYIYRDIYIYIWI